MEKTELKIMALRESMAEKVNAYEDKIADLRVDLTINVQQIEALQAENAELRDQIDKLSTAIEPQEKNVSKKATAKKSAN